MQSIHLTSALMKVKGGGTENGNRRGFQADGKDVQLCAYCVVNLCPIRTQMK